jgi:hypothetical protein
MDNATLLRTMFKISEGAKVCNFAMAIPNDSNLKYDALTKLKRKLKCLKYFQKKFPI